MKDSELLGKRISKRWWGSGWFPLKVQMGDFWFCGSPEFIGKTTKFLGVFLEIFELGLKKRGKPCFFFQKKTQEQVVDLSCCGSRKGRGITGEYLKCRRMRILGASGSFSSP